MLREMLENVRTKGPLVHNITNYVTVNDCANIILACGASPIMADDEGEVDDITSLCAALNINIGTLNRNTIPSMLLAGKKAAQLGHPILLDPVGAGASKLRTQTALQLLREIPFTVIRGNVSEIKTLIKGCGDTQGVDANASDRVTEKNLAEVLTWVKAFALRQKTIIAMTGAIDIITDGSQSYVVRNGHPLLTHITGSGCMLSALTAAYLAANPGHYLEAAAAADCAMSLAGEEAANRMSGLDGNGSFRTFLVDAVSNMTPSDLERGARYEVR